MHVQIPNARVYCFFIVTFFVINLLSVYDVGVWVQTCHDMHVETEGHLLGTVLSHLISEAEFFSLFLPLRYLQELSANSCFSRNAEITELTYTQVF